MMHILGIANGTPSGNSEILLKAALTAATASNPSITTSWIHAPSISIPPNPKPLSGSQDVSQGSNEAFKTEDDNDTTTATTTKNQNEHTTVKPIPDDRLSILNAILHADALIFSTPIYSHQPLGTLKAVIDRILGPFTDVAFARKTLARQEKEAKASTSTSTVDKRLLKPRVVGFMAVGGSTFADQSTMALPTLHNLVYSLHAKVVDQEVFRGYGAPGSVLLSSSFSFSSSSSSRSIYGEGGGDDDDDDEDGPAIARAKKLGLNVASQMGLSFDEAAYLGAEPEGACPFCHLAKVELFCSSAGGPTGFGKNEIMCVTCGAEGRLVVGEADGVVRPEWNAQSGISCITMKGKEKHVEDIVEAGRREMESMKRDSRGVGARREYWGDVRIEMVEMPSQRSE